MAEAIKPIKRLSSETQAHVQSSVEITSLIEVILELVKNALDARASNIAVRLDLMKGHCSVLDNGVGIPQEEFLDNGGLAKLHHTSKDARSLSFGRHGRFLASLSAVSLLTITSICTTSASTNTLILKDGRRVGTALNTGEGLDNYLHGTRVVVHNLFGKLPVRVKHRLMRLQKRSELEKEFLQLKLQLVALILSSPNPLHFSLQEAAGQLHFVHKPIRTTDGDDFNPGAIESTLLQAGLINQKTAQWNQVVGETTHISVRAAFCINPSPTSQLQFISINHQPVHDAFILQMINQLFQKSDFGLINDSVEKSKGEGFRDHRFQQHTSTYQHNRKQKAIDRWPVFYICVITLPALHDKNEALHVDAIMAAFLDPLLDIIATVVREFLNSQHLLAEERNCKTRTNRSTQAVLSLPERRHSDFSTWSRVKSAKPAMVNDMLAGLPFSVANPSTASSSDASLLTHNCLRKSPECLNPSDNELVWKDSRTGGMIKLNARTGAVLPTAEPQKSEGIAIGTRPTESISDIKTVANLLAACGHLPVTYETPIPSLDDEQPSHRFHAFTSHRGILDRPGDFSVITKAGLSDAKVLGQIENKFILASIQVKDMLLVLIDQHAADERVKIENLFKQICSDTPTTLLQPVSFDVTLPEAKLFQIHRNYFASWNILLEINQTTIQVTALPELIAERCSIQPGLLIEILRQAVWSNPGLRPATCNDWLASISNCPQGVLDMLISRACRSAIMFNDFLTTSQCQTLVSELGRCVFPFQCAHGRPSMTILGKLGDLEQIESVSSFGQVWKKWIDAR